MVVERVECWVPRQSADTLYTAHLVQNSPYREIHVKLVECLYLWRKLAVKDFTRNPTALRGAIHREVELLWPITHVWPS